MRKHRGVTIAAAVLVLLSVVVVVLIGRGDGPPTAGSGPHTATAPQTSATSTTTTSSTTTGTITTTTTTPRTVAPPTAAPFPVELRGQDVTVLPTRLNVVALTFDAGANSAGLPKILRTLADQRVAATFFLTGNWAQANPAGVASIVAAGHRVGNHTMTHPYLRQLADPAILDEIRHAEAAIRTAGADARPLFRFPFGDRDARTIAAVNSAGYAAVRWTVDTLGWKGTNGGMSARGVTERAIGSLQPGEIVLMHIGSNPDDGSTLDADALPEVIASVRARGYGFVTLDALLGRT